VSDSRTLDGSDYPSHAAQPAVLALQPGQQPAQVRPDPTARLDPAEPARDQSQQRIQRSDPPSKINHAVIITGDRIPASHDTAEVPLQYSTSKSE
jgi:hypothetical protein